MRALGKDDVVVPDRFRDEAAGIRDEFLAARYGTGRRKGGDEVGIAAFEVPEVMQVAVGEDDKAAILREGVFPSLLFSNEWALVFGLCFEDDEWKTLLVEKKEVDEAFFACSKFSPRASRSCVLSVTLGSSWMLAGDVPSAKKRQPAASSSLLILMRAAASFIRRTLETRQ